jgi:hypothetical protein
VGEERRGEERREGSAKVKAGQGGEEIGRNGWACGKKRRGGEEGSRYTGIGDTDNGERP